MIAQAGPDVEVLRDRVLRAGEIRAAIGDVWNAYVSRQPRRFGLLAVPGSEFHWTLVINTIEPMPTRVSTLFGEWLYLLRAALDGAAYYVAVRDSGQNPPPNEGAIYFPIKTSATTYDSSSHREKLKALSDSTFADLRVAQPFNAQPDHKSNVLWWIDELARIDRHRGGHALAAHIMSVRIELQHPLTLVKSHLREPAADRLPINETGPMPILDLSAPVGFDERAIREHIGIEDSVESSIDVTEWVSSASKLMKSKDLEERMRLCEAFVLHDIIEPMVASRISPPSSWVPRQSQSAEDPQDRSSA